MCSGDCAGCGARKTTEVWGRLSAVTDPEIDEPIVDMGFVERIEVIADDDGGHAVEIDFRLPTYWCSPNFAYLMAEDIHREVTALPWAEKVTVTLQDHSYAERINEGVNNGIAFSEIFAEFSDDTDLSELREKFVQKAFQRRQEVMLLAFQESGATVSKIVSMTLANFDETPFEGGEEAAQKPRYRELLIEKGLASEPDDLAFRTYEGEALRADELEVYLQQLRSVRINMEFNGALCRGLAQARYKEKAETLPPDREPELIDFILNRVPPREASPMPTG